MEIGIAGSEHFPALTVENHNIKIVGAEVIFDVELIVYAVAVGRENVRNVEFYVFQYLKAHSGVLFALAERLPEIEDIFVWRIEQKRNLAVLKI